MPEHGPARSQSDVGRGPRLVTVRNYSRYHGEKIVFFQYPAPCFAQCWQAAIIFPVPDNFSDAGHGVLCPIDIDGHETFLGEVIRGIRTAGIEGQGQAEKAIRQFLRPVMSCEVVFDGQMVIVSIDGFGLVGHGFDAASENFEFRIHAFERADEFIPVMMNPGFMLLGGGYGGERLGFDRVGGMHLLPGSGPRFILAVIPAHGRLRVDPLPVRQLQFRLAGENVAELTGECRAVDLYRRRFIGHQQGIVPRTGEQFFVQGKTFRCARWQIVIDHQPVILPLRRIEHEPALAPFRFRAGKIAQPFDLRQSGQDLDSESGHKLMNQIAARAACSGS
ncbi:MAG: hypothetical protein HW386_1621 [Gammaproteobacteria bacterium]|nr:hypothetical protein [Gammaproteobacteria bacterium]